MKIQKQFILFSLIGTLGLCVDLITLYFTSKFFDFIFARLISFIFAVITTWILNRNITFEAANLLYSDDSIYILYLTEFIKYLITNSLGGIINLSTYYFLITYDKIDVGIYIATILGGGAGLILNFILSKIIVFNQNIYK